MPLVTAAFLGYFGFHAFSGSFGLWARERLELEATRLTEELGQLKVQRAAIEKQVSRLRTESLDADLIDAQARVALNVMRPDEIVIPLGAPQQSQR